MANYYSSARSNYFKVKNVKSFQDQFIDVFGGMTLIKDNEERVGFLVHDENGIPSHAIDQEGNELDLDFDTELSKHLQDGEVAIYQEVGAEKLRYLNGYSTAVNSKGKSVSISISDIYKLAQEELGAQNVTACEY